MMMMMLMMMLMIMMIMMSRMIIIFIMRSCINYRHGGDSCTYCCCVECVDHISSQRDDQLRYSKRFACTVCCISHSACVYG